MREHPQLRLYLKREEYEILKELAEEKGVSMKDVVLEAIKGIVTRYRRGYERGWEDALATFINDPHQFYVRVMERAVKMGLRDFEPALFTVPCKYCGEPMIFTHRDDNWKSEKRPELLNAFSSWYHVRCWPR